MDCGMNINVSLDPSRLKRTFEAEGMMAIEGFLTVESAEEISRFLGENMPVHLWNAAIGPNPATGNGWLSLSMTADGSQRAKEERERLAPRFLSEQFSYSFKRSDGHEGCGCTQCKYHSFLSSPKVLQFISEATGIELTRTQGVFSSWYDEGDFLCVHTDIGQGQVAFVLNLARDWKFIYGGNLVMFEKDHRTPKKIFIPGFNTLILFRVPEHGVPHCVTHVVPGIGTWKSRRIAISGWYK